MITEIQDALMEQGLDGWLFFDHHRRDPLAYQILKLGNAASASRRWYYFVPASGAPRKLVHRIEAAILEDLPGDCDTYSSWLEQQGKLAWLLAGAQRVAMQYSPNCAIPYVSTIDGGTLELIRSTAVEVVSSADLVQTFEARWSSIQVESHLQAGIKVDRIRREAFAFAGEHLRTGLPIGEYEVQKFILNRFHDEGLVTDHGPIVAVNENTSDPHYEPSPSKSRPIGVGDVLLIDLWAKLQSEDAVYYDITWTGFCGLSIPSDVSNVFEIVKGARKVASDLVISRTANNVVLFGWEVDDAARGYIGARGFGNYFFHRTGHSIGTEVHGNGANMDNFESHDGRRVIPDTCFSIEPGIYLPHFGIRSEVNILVQAGQARVTGEQQESLISVLD